MTTIAMAERETRWLPTDPGSIWALGHRIVRCDDTTNNFTIPIAYCDTPLVAQILADALKEHIRKEKIRREICSR